MLDRAFLGELRRPVRQGTGRPARSRSIELAGEDFNIQSPKQLAVILFEKLGLKPIKKTATGWSTDVSVLTALADEHELPALILEYRQVAKLQNTYVETLPQLANPGHGPDPHLLQPGRGGHRAAVQLRSQPAEHPRAHRTGPADPAGLRAARRRTTSSCRRTTPRSSCGCWPTWPTTRACRRPSARAPTCTGAPPP